MLPDEMEAEKNRKIILAQADEIEILKRNVRQLQGQYQSALVHKKRLIEQNAEAMVIIGHKQQEIDYLKERCNFSDVESHYLNNSIIVEREEV
tara:strand:+ start:297 stop:575 length:279 start_codon:yes stop_codon:yes gene_type:complete